MKDFYTSNGFYSPLRVITEKQAKLYRNKLESVESKLGPLHYTVKIFTVMKWVFDIAKNKIILDFVEQLIGKNILLYNTTFIIKEPKTKTHVSWHQDLTYWGFNNNEKQVSAWLALSIADNNSGCMQMIPGSHKKGFFKHKSIIDSENVLSRGQTVLNVDTSKAVSCPLKPGEVSFHHGLTLHASQPNISNDRRIGLNIQYISTDMKQLNSKNDSAICVRGEDTHKNFKENTVAKEDFDNQEYANLLKLNQHYNKTIRNN
tara:strand:- start:291 stop:1070 length:780 start_codon:yes stop_codon:yes gene_type:complete